MFKAKGGGRKSTISKRPFMKQKRENKNYSQVMRVQFTLHAGAC